jgi:hypothetical protein
MPRRDGDDPLISAHDRAAAGACARWRARGAPKFAVRVLLLPEEAASRSAASKEALTMTRTKTSKTTLRIGLLAAIALGTLGTVGCSSEEGGEAVGDEEMLTTVSAAEFAAAQRQDISRFTFDRLTPAGTKLMRAAHRWMDVQDDEKRFPQPRMCAVNVSKVLFLGGITRYDQEGVRNLIAEIGVPGSVVAKMPQTKSGFLAKLNSAFEGRIPAGTVIVGMSVTSSEPGDQHVGLIGHTDPDGTVWIYHNNWYRPENEGGKRKPHMISEENIQRGFLRQWMPTPWVRITRDAAGNAVDVTSLLPALDDMDPFNTGFQVTLALAQEIASELGGAVTDPVGPGGDASSCTVTDPDGFTHLREDGSASRVLASVKANTTLQVVAREGARSRVDLEGWVSVGLTSCAGAADCGARVRIADANPGALGSATGTNLRVAAETSSALAAVVANDTTVEVLSRRGDRLQVRLRGTVGSDRCD